MSDVDRFEIKQVKGTNIIAWKHFVEEIKKHAEKIDEEQLKSLLIVDTESLKQITKPDTVQQQIHKLEDRETLSEARIDRLEFQVNVMPFREKLERIREFISKSYSDIKGLKTVAFLPSGTGIRIITIHEIDNRVEALNKLQKSFFQVENAFSGIYFEQVVLHITQVDPIILKNAELILQN